VLGFATSLLLLTFIFKYCSFHKSVLKFFKNMQLLTSKAMWLLIIYNPNFSFTFNFFEGHGATKNSTILLEKFKMAEFYYWLSSDLEI